MAYQVLYSTRGAVERRNCANREQILSHLWSIDVGRSTLITIVNLASFGATCGTREKLIDVLGSSGFDEIFG